MKIFLVKINYFIIFFLGLYREKKKYLETIYLTKKIVFLQNTLRSVLHYFFLYLKKRGCQTYLGTVTMNPVSIKFRTLS